MFRIAPFRQRGGFGSFMPQAFSDLLNWTEGSWQGFSVDVKETEGSYELKADLPGIAKDNIHIGLNDGYLTIAVRQEDVREEEKQNYIRRERRRVANQRSFYVGNINPADVKAEHKDGVLEITFPKAQAGPQGQIPIH
ncbi:MAG TPA: Hsp20/alpha crystallin family protein [Firmicutes bacterium]|nr:Hsp20/alpha crystallin family protein [Bacillota bacterium]